VDEGRFDDLARALGGSRSRRGLLGALLPAVAAMRSHGVFAASSPVSGHAEVIAQGTARLAGSLVWRVSRHPGPASPTTPALGFLLAAGGSLLVTGDDGTRTLLTDGAAAFTPDGARQTLVRFGGGAGVGWRLSLIPASQTASAEELIFASDPFAAPSGTRALELARDVLRRKEMGALPDAGQPALVLAVSGALRVQANQGKTRTLNAGDADLFTGALTLTAGSKGAVYVAARIGPDLDHPEAASPTPSPAAGAASGAGGNGSSDDGAGAGNGSSGGSTGESCSSGQTACGGVCVNLMIDLNTCGGCGAACASGQDCEDGVCTNTTPSSPCSGGQSLCGGVCVDTGNDPNNCGACGAVCNAQCDQGRCACSQGLTACSGGCVDLSSDDGNCGKCNVACPAGSGCNGGLCAYTECPGGHASCGGVCTDTGSDANNCGGCGNVCGAPHTQCLNAQCSCPGSLSPCNGGCVDFLTDTNNCGGCGLACFQGLGADSCQNGKCG
jgi:hypothetical protein